MRTQTARLLIRSNQPTPAQAKFAAAGNTFRLDASPSGGPWNAFEANGQATVAELWDAAYDLAERAQAPVEPDVENLWVLPTSKRQRGLFAGGPEDDRGIVNLQSPEFPQGPGFAWHLRPEYSQLQKAREAITNPQTVRGAIFDVGYDFNHRSAPQHLRTDLQRNFTGDGDPTAADPDRGGILQNPGHGTATLALLAGRELQGMKAPTPSGFALGGAPGIEVIPIRIATSVLLLRTSAFAEALRYLISLQGHASTAVDVLSMSMGGVASGAWADAVNEAYDKGILMVTAAGNNYGAPKSIVFPARFNRVLAACGIMADFTPYDLPLGKMSGNYGPDGKMDTAIAAFTPNMPWAEIGSANIVDWDGEGTSSATPQVAAAAALWLQKHKASVAGWDPWQRVEMVRTALFEKADRSRPGSRKHFGQGVLRAFDSLSVKATAAARAKLVQQPKDSAAFAFFRALRGLVFQAAPANPLESAFDLELTQLMHRDPNFEAALPDPANLTDPKQLEQLLDAAIESPHASNRLKEALRASHQRPGTAPRKRLAQGGKREFHPNTPTERRLRVFAFDPAASQSLASAAIAITTVAIPWEDLQPGPRGEYIEVIDHDPSCRCFYAPVDLEDRLLLSTDGLTPLERDPKFHQQMVYAVAMRTIRTFERALGRRALWSPVMEGRREAQYVGQLRIYPHALRARNAYYNPLKKALLFGYFPARPLSPGTMNPGGIVFTCLSHDVVAHEMSHALLDGMASGLASPTNGDMLAFHEAFADLVALFQHFALPHILNHQLARTRGSLRVKSYLVELAQQFGEGSGLHGALRSYLGIEPDPNAIDAATEPHTRGAILVAAIFDAFVTIYEHRVADLRRIASEGTGILREGELHPDLVNRLAAEASKTASQVLRMCIRAIDYCPPVDLTFGDYLRALITADMDLYPDDAYFYRPALIDAFRKRGIYPRDVRTMSPDSLSWHPPDETTIEIFSSTEAGVKLRFRLRLLGDLVRRVSRADEVEWPLPDRKILDEFQPSRFSRQAPPGSSPRLGGPLPARQAVYHLLRQERAQVHDLLEEALKQMPEANREKLLRELGVFDADSGQARFEVYALNFAEREDASGTVHRDVIVSLRHERDGRVGGCTIITNCDTGEIRFLVRKSWGSRSRQAWADSGKSWGSTYLGHTPFAGPGSRFAVVHDHSDELSEDEGYA